MPPEQGGKNGRRRMSAYLHLDHLTKSKHEKSASVAFQVWKRHLTLTLTLTLTLALALALTLTRALALTLTLTLTPTP